MTLSRRHFLSASAAGTALFGLGLSPAFGEAKAGLDWRLGYTSAPAGGFDPAPMKLVYGQVPAGLEGALYRNGPAQFLYGKDDYASHWFDGDGMVQKIAIADGQAVHSGRFVATVKRATEQADESLRRVFLGRVLEPPHDAVGVHERDRRGRRVQSTRAVQHDVIGVLAHELLGGAPLAVVGVHRPNATGNHHHFV
jgi:carotenoid cleavage dioxygenase-like enzyme